MISRIELTNFRRFSYLNLSINKNISIITGSNALGKTSILEAIYLSSVGKSHRTNDDLELIKFESPYSIIRVFDKKTYQIIISKEGKKLLINKIEQKRISDFIGDLQAIMFSPDDLKLIKGSPTDTRKFIDIEISKINKQYLYNLNLYKKYLKQRNDLLKQLSLDDDQLFLNIITKQLIEVGKKIIDERKKFIEEINIYAKKYHMFLSNNDLTISYQASCEKDNIEEIFEAHKKQDILTKITNYGPHRDDLGFKVNDLEAKVFSSQGEKRTVVIAIKMALIDYIKNKTDKNPVILLDDCLSELDMDRQIKLIGALKNGYQTFISATDIESIKNILQCDYELIDLKGVVKNGTTL